MELALSNAKLASKRTGTEEGEIEITRIFSLLEQDQFFEELKNFSVEK